MPERSPSSLDLATLLDRLRLEPAGNKAPAIVAQAQLDLLLARIAALTDALRAGGSTGDRAAARLLLTDLGMVAAQFRGQTNALSETLSGSLAALDEALEKLPAE